MKTVAIEDMVGWTVACFLLDLERLGFDKGSKATVAELVKWFEELGEEGVRELGAKMVDFIKETDDGEAKV